MREADGAVKLCVDLKTGCGGLAWLPGTRVDFACSHADGTFPTDLSNPVQRSMTTEITSYLEERRVALERAVGKQLVRPAATAAEPLTGDERTYLRDEALDLYWNDLEWENLTEEERLDDGGALTEMAFPGFLAFVRGLLLKEAMPDAGAEAIPRPEVVEDVLAFLSGRVLELQASVDGEQDAEELERLRGELAMTGQLVDLVLLRLYEVDPNDL